MSESVYFLTLLFPFGTILLVFGMKYLSAVKQAKARLESEESYRLIAQKAVAAQAEAAESLAEIKATLADVNARVASIEKVLKEVE